MGQGQPLRQQPRGIVGGLAIERHHGGGNTGHAAQLGAPAVANRRHLDVIRAPADGLVKTMHSHVSGTSFPNRSHRGCARIPIAFAGLRDYPQSTCRRPRGNPWGGGGLNSTQPPGAIKRRRSRRKRPQPIAALLHEGLLINIFLGGGFSTGFARGMHRISTSAVEAPRCQPSRRAANGGAHCETS